MIKKWVDYSSKYGLGYLLSNKYSGYFSMLVVNYFKSRNKYIFLYRKKNFR